MFAKAGRLVWLKGEADVTHYQHSGSLHTKSFCQCCGSALPTVAESIDCVVVPAGSLDTPISVTPTAKIFVADCAAWSVDLSNVPSFDALPGQVNQDSK
ncbi:MAG: aldehyde-activating protein [Idiomarina sp.]|nr:aldehyde-activating protein [Idiomarina sp.]